MFDDFKEFNPWDVKPKEEPPDTVVTPCPGSDTSPLKLSDEHNFCLNTEVKTFDDYIRQEDSQTN